jgi:hypothetical protein
MAEPGNIAIPTLSGMMLDRGTKTLDKFAIAEQLDNVGAEIAFTVGTQSLEFRAKCLTKDLPTDHRPDRRGAAHSCVSVRRSSARRSSNSSAPAGLGAEHRGASAGGLRPRGLSPRASESAAHGQRLRGCREAGHPG